MSETNTPQAVAAQAEEAKENKEVGHRTHMAGAFDIRNVIGALLGIYGVVLLLSYFLLDPGVDPTTGQPKDSVYNLWAAVVLIAVAVVFMAWTKLNPIKIEE